MISICSASALQDIPRAPLAIEACWPVSVFNICTVYVPFLFNLRVGSQSGLLLGMGPVYHISMCIAYALNLWGLDMLYIYSP